MELVAAEPVIRQPVDLHFDDRGRLWVVQYLQYPFPAGLTITAYDQYLRARYDRVPAPPPNHVRGADKITRARGQGRRWIVRVAPGRHHRPEHHHERPDRARRCLGHEPALPALLSGHDRRRAPRRRARSAVVRLRTRGHALARQQPDVGPRWMALRRARQHEHGARPRRVVPRPGGLALSPRYRRLRAVRAGRRQSVDAVVRQQGARVLRRQRRQQPRLPLGTRRTLREELAEARPVQPAVFVRLHPEHGPRGLRRPVRDDLRRSTKTDSCRGTRDS